MRGMALMLATLISLPLGAAETRAFDHAAFDALLRRHVRDGRVDYDAFQAAPTFRAYLDALDAANPAVLDEPERLAFWINAYNAYTIALIVQHGERESIRNINKTLGLVAAKGPWKEPLVRAGGRRLTLDEVENEIVRKQFHEPRIHFALVCAALSCPPLRAEAYVGARLDAQLDEQARVFLLHTPAGNRVDVAARRLYVSPIFDWYRQDFGGSDASIARFIAQYYAAGPERDLLLGGSFKLETTPYDWTLNSRARAGGSQ